VRLSSGERRRYLYWLLLTVAVACFSVVSLPSQSHEAGGPAVPEPASTAPGAALTSSTLLPELALEGGANPVDPAKTGPVEAALKVAGARINVSAKSEEILEHLTEVVRNYRMSISFVQKVGEPSDTIYAQQSVINAKLVSSYAFQAATAAVTLLTTYGRRPAGVDRNQSQSESRRVQTVLTAVAKKVGILEVEKKLLEEQAPRGSREDLKELRARIEQNQASLGLYLAMSESLGKIASMSDTHGQSGLGGDIERLKQTAPGITDVSAKVITAPLTALDVERSSGISSQASGLFNLLATRQALELQLHEIEALQGQALSLRAPLVGFLSGILHEGEAVSPRAQGNTPGPSSPEPDITVAGVAAIGAPAGTTATQLDDITATFNTLGASAVPLSQEIIALEQSRANLLAWHTAVDVEYHDARRSLLQRALAIVVALTFVLVMGEFWRRATVHYVKGAGLRRQQLGLQRLVVSFLCLLVVIFGFVTHFGSLATFAGFITAGLAVALQTILLSVAAYFFLIGRSGIRAGDRISVAGVTGDVMDVGLVQFYVMELAVSGLGVQPTGRVAIFSNAILFQAGAPIYKQIPGANYAWHEMTVMLKQSADYAHATQILLGGVQHIYDGYKQGIEKAYLEGQPSRDTEMNAPRIQSRVQFVDGGLQLTVRFPVKILEASKITQEITESMLQLIQGDDLVKQAVASTPIITAAVKL
jgi:small-conductance mechanosensitive channel